jgi:hypothetical protein
VDKVGGCYRYPGLIKASVSQPLSILSTNAYPKYNTAY